MRVFLDRTPFYAEGGGQVGDHGVIRTHTGSVRVLDTQKAGDRAIVHEGVVESGEIRPGQDAIAEIDRLFREGTARAHTSTHVIHATLRRILGEHARQAGSLIEPGRLRFDFSHPSGVPIEVLEQAELEANRRLAQDDVVRIFETSMDEAQALGATALFGEKYGSIVRVVEIGDYSRELCGGTHVGRTGTVAVIRLLREGSIGAGMRRIEALVGPDALREINVERALLRDLVGALDAKDPRAAVERARKVLEENKRLRNELGKLRAGGRDQLIADLADAAGEIEGVALVTADVPDLDPGELRELAIKIRDRLQDRPAVVVVGNGTGGKAMLVAAATPARSHGARRLRPCWPTRPPRSAAGPVGRTNSPTPAVPVRTGSPRRSARSRVGSGRSWSARERDGARPGARARSRRRADRCGDQRSRSTRRGADRHDPRREPARRAVRDRGTRPRARRRAHRHRRAAVHGWHARHAGVPRSRVRRRGPGRRRRCRCSCRTSVSRPWRRPAACTTRARARSGSER